METKFKFQLGDLVVLNSFPQKQVKSADDNSSNTSNTEAQNNLLPQTQTKSAEENSSETSSPEGQEIPVEPIKKEKNEVFFDLNNSDMPIMVIHEIAHNPNMEKLFEEQTGKQIASKNKYLCFWFSQKLCGFSSSWFYEDQITLFKKIETEKQLDLPKIGDLAEYFTNLIESQRLRKNNDSEFKKSNRFLPPKLSVKSIVPEKTPTLYDQKKGILVSQKTILWVKCIWYNSNTNKFSEELLPIESLIIEKKETNE